MHFKQSVCGFALALLFPLLVSSSNASKSAQRTCLEFNEEYPDITLLQSDPDYDSNRTINWSQTAWAKPTCIVTPSKEETLQKIVQTLSSRGINFAIRSGGHMPSPEAANINGGVLISLAGFDQVVYDEETRLVEVGGGLRWGDVYNELDKHEVTAVGGRVLGVGVGGLLLGGGLSYLSNLYGMACDNVASFQVVLADGRLVNANADSHPDLFWALKGGANNFGIVTKFTLHTYPIHQVWGGVKQYSLDQIPRLLAAVQAYQTSNLQDPYANFMLQVFKGDGLQGAVMNMVYLKPEKEPAAFAPFASIPTMNDLTKLQTLTEMMSGQMVPPNPRWDWSSTSFKPAPGVYDTIAQKFTNGSELKTIRSVAGGVLSLGIQPISYGAITAGEEQGGNVLGLSKDPQTWFVVDAGWNKTADDQTVHRAMRSFSDGVEDKAKEKEAYLPYIFMNDASWDQDVLGHYGEKNVQRLKEVQRKYDPERVFQRLVPGGFKLK